MSLLYDDVVDVAVLERLIAESEVSEARLSNRRRPVEIVDIADPGDVAETDESSAGVSLRLLESADFDGDAALSLLSRVYFPPRLLQLAEVAVPPMLLISLCIFRLLLVRWYVPLGRLLPPGGEGESGDLMGVNCTLGSRFKYLDISCVVVMAWDWANRALVEAEDLYETKSSESSEEVVVAEVPAEPALKTVAWDEADDDDALDLLRMALYSSVESELVGLWSRPLPPDEA